jgi:hypothetical protein
MVCERLLKCARRAGVAFFFKIHSSLFFPLAIQPEHSAIADTLTYCDMTTGPTSLDMSFEERLDDIFRRYDEGTIVNLAIYQALPALTCAVKRTQALLAQDEK